MFSNGIVNRKFTACSVATVPNLYLIHCLKLHSISVRYMKVEKVMNIY